MHAFGLAIWQLRQHAIAGERLAKCLLALPQLKSGQRRQQQLLTGTLGVPGYSYSWPLIPETASLAHTGNMQQLLTEHGSSNTSLACADC